MADYITYFWRFGDGTTSAEKTPTHVYFMPGVYTWVMTATSTNGGTKTVTGVINVTEWSENSTELNAAYTNISLRIPLRPEQGREWLLHSGTWVYPSARAGAVKIYDDNGNEKQIVFDRSNGLPFDISTRPGPTGSGLTKVRKDQVGIEQTIIGITLSGTNPVAVEATEHSLVNGQTVTFSSVGGTTELNGNEYVITVVDVDNITLNSTDSSNFTAWTSGGTVKYIGEAITPNILFGEDRGSREHFFISDLESHVYARPIEESDGFETGTEMDLYLYKDGAVTPSVVSKNIVKTHQTMFDRKVRGNRLQYKLVINTAKIIITGISHYFKIEDSAADPDTAAKTETDYQTNLSNVVFWLSRGSQPLLDRSSGVLLTLNGTVSQIAGPDGKSNSAIKTSNLLSLNNSEYANGMVMMWYEANFPTIPAISFVDYNNIGTWIMGTSTGLIPANLTLFPFPVFDIRIFSSPLSAADLLYYYDDMNEYSGKNCLPLF
jgi:PKD repeat protein